MADIRSVKNSTTAGTDEYVEQIRQKIGTEFSDRKVSGKKKNELGKDDFIKLMSAQLKYQDPISPLKNEEMAAQLAQFAALEQMTNMNQNLEKMTAAQKPSDNVLAASLIGKRIGTDSSRFVYAKGTQPEMKFDLPKDAENVSVTMVDAKGEVIRDIELGSMAKGSQAIRWDGKSNRNLDATPGEFTFRVNALDNRGQPIEVSTNTSGLVSGVSFEGGKAMLLVDGKKVPLEAVGKIEADTAKPLTAAPSAPGDVKSQGITQQVKKDLPKDIEDEKINSKLGSSSEAVKRLKPEVQESEEIDSLQSPLWNPARM